MTQTVNEQRVKEIIDESLKNFPSSNRVDDGKTEREQIDFLVSNKVDARNTVDYTFAGTGVEAISHNLGRIPKGYSVISATLSRNVIGDSALWTKQRVFLTSPAANNKVRLLFL